MTAHRHGGEEAAGPVRVAPWCSARECRAPERGGLRTGDGAMTARPACCFGLNHGSRVMRALAGILADGNPLTPGALRT